MDFVCDEVTYSLTVFKTPADVVRHNFLVQKSITCLDLSIGEYSKGIKFLSTEEDVKKNVLSCKDVMYRLGLDYTRKLKISLTTEANFFTPLPAFGNDGFQFLFAANSSVYNRGLETYIANALQDSEDEVSTLRKYLPLIKKSQLFEADIYRIDKLFDKVLVILRYCNDPKMVMDFMECCEGAFETLVCRCRDTYEMEYLLKCSLKCKNFPMDGESSPDDPITTSITCGRPQNVFPFLKYGYMPWYDICIYQQLLVAASYNADSYLICPFDDEYCPEGYVLKRRIWMLFLMVIFTDTSNYSDPISGLPARDMLLSQLWRVVAEPFLVFEEIIRFLGEHVDLMFLAEMWRFYVRNVREGDCVYQGPRKLKHLCRVVIRKTLRMNFALPSHVKHLQIPKILQSYLKLRD